MFYRTCIVCVKNEFKLDILQDSEPPHKENRNYCANCNQVMHYTVLNKEMNSVKPEIQVPRINRQ